MCTHDGILSKTIELGAKLMPYVLYVLCRPIRRELNKEVKTILDVGCGRGLTAKAAIRPRKLFAVGADIFESDLRIAKKSRTHDDFVLCDARSLPFKSKSFDVVLCTEMLEHVDKEEGLILLRDMEDIAQKKVILSTPRGFFPSMRDALPSYTGNPYQEHVAGWEPNELRAMGYTVYCNEYLYRIEEFLNNRHRTWSWILNIVIFSLLGPLNWLSPKFGSHLFCIKEMEQTK